jgi:hypothetical protein
VLLYSFTDASRISSRNDRLWSDLLSQLPSNIYMLGNQKIPNLLFEDVGLRANLMYGAFALALLLALISGLRKQEAGVVFISLSCTSAILFVTVFYFQDHRFLVYIFPFLYLLILLPRETRPIGYMFVALVLISSLGTFVQGFHRVPASRFWLYLHEQHVTLPDNDPLLISEKSRHPYFFLRGRTARGELRWDQIISHSNLFVLGSDDFVSRSLTKIKIMAEAANFTFERQNLTSGYEDEEGHALIQLYNFCPQ